MAYQVLLRTNESKLPIKGYVLMRQIMKTDIEYKFMKKLVDKKYNTWNKREQTRSMVDEIISIERLHVAFPTGKNI